MSAALKISPKYYLEREQVKIHRSLRHSDHLKKVVSEYSASEAMDITEREIRNERINSIKGKLFEEKLALLHGGSQALAIHSFPEAQRLIFSSILRSGDNIVNYNSYSSFNFLENFVEVRTGVGSIDELKDAVDANTKAIYVETLNDVLSIPDFQRIATIARSNGILLIVDNTSAIGGFFSTPLRNGANIVIEDSRSLFKDADPLIGAVIVEGGNFNWNNGKFEQLPKKSGKKGFLLTEYLRSKYKVSYKEIAAASDEALDLINALENLPSLLKTQSSVSLSLAQWLAKKPNVSKVSYPGLVSSPSYFNALKYFKNGFGNKLQFKVEGDVTDFEVFVYNLQRTKVILNNSKNRNYKIGYNRETLTVIITIFSGTFEDVSEDFLYAFNQLSKFRNLINPRFLFQQI
jgi:O-acetylhomoserine/O-acetylserine sulfhydrylase